MYEYLEASNLLKFCQNFKGKIYVTVLKASGSFKTIPDEILEAYGKSIYYFYFF